MGKTNNFFLGLDEVCGELNFNVDKSLKGDYIAHFAKCLNAKAVRIWIRTPELIKVLPHDEIQFIPDELIKLNAYLNKLKEVGVEKFILLDWGFVYPYNYQASDITIVPDPETERNYYERFLLLQKKVRYEIARNFMEIEYYEMLNEPDGIDGSFMHKNNYKLGKDRNVNADYIFSRDEVIRIILDLDYYTSLGIKEANPDAMVLLPSFWNVASAPDFLDAIYTKIENGEFPSISKNKCTTIDNYFDILNFHPYNLKDSDINDFWLSTQLALYDVMKKHGDDKRKVWYTEIGWADYKREGEKQIIGQRFIDLLNTVRDKLPFVEGIFLFRLFNLANKCENDGENNFGLVYNEYDWNYPLMPKPSIKAIYKYLHNTDDLSPLYAFSKLKAENENYFDNLINPGKNHKVLFLGSKVTYQPKNELLNHKFNGGIGASKLENDYVHQIKRVFDRKFKDDVTYLVANVDKWENEFANPDLNKKLDKYFDFDPEITILQIGDEVMANIFNDYDFSIYFEDVIKKLNPKKTKIVAIAPINNYQPVYNIISSICLKYNIPLVETRFITKAIHSSLLNDEYPYRPTDDNHHELSELIIKALE